MTDPGRKPGTAKLLLLSTTSVGAALCPTFAFASFQTTRHADHAAGAALVGARRAVEAFLAEPAVRDSTFVAALSSDTAGASVEVQVGGDHLIGRAGPMRSVAGDVRGGFVALRTRAESLGGFHAVRRTLVLAMVVGVVVGVGTAILVARRLSHLPS